MVSRCCSVVLGCYHLKGLPRGSSTVPDGPWLPATARTGSYNGTITSNISHSAEQLKSGNVTKGSLVGKLFPKQNTGQIIHSILLQNCINTRRPRSTECETAF